MQILTSDELIRIKLKTRRSEKISKAAHIYNEVDALAIGDGLLVKKDEWPLKSTPTNIGFPKRVRSGGRHYRVRTLSDDSGFVIVRTA